MRRRCPGDTTLPQLRATSKALPGSGGTTLPRRTKMATPLPYWHLYVWQYVEKGGDVGPIFQKVGTSDRSGAKQKVGTSDRSEKDQKSDARSFLTFPPFAKRWERRADAKKRWERLGGSTEKVGTSDRLRFLLQKGGNVYGGRMKRWERRCDRWNRRTAVQSAPHPRP